MAVEIKKGAVVLVKGSGIDFIDGFKCSVKSNSRQQSNFLEIGQEYVITVTEPNYPTGNWTASLKSWQPVSDYCTYKFQNIHKWEQ